MRGRTRAREGGRESCYRLEREGKLQVWSPGIQVSTCVSRRERGRGINPAPRSNPVSKGHCPLNLVERPLSRADSGVPGLEYFLEEKGGDRVDTAPWRKMVSS